MKDTTDDEFDSVTTSGKVLVDFYSTWCQPCKTIAVILEKLEGETSDITFLKLNIDEQPAATHKFDITCLPVLVLLEDGEEVRRHLGSISEPALRSWLGV